MEQEGTPAATIADWEKFKVEFGMLLIQLTDARNERARFESLWVGARESAIAAERRLLEMRTEKEALTILRVRMHAELEQYSIGYAPESEILECNACNGRLGANGVNHKPTCSIAQVLAASTAMDVAIAKASRP